MKDADRLTELEARMDTLERYLRGEGDLQGTPLRQNPLPTSIEVSEEVLDLRKELRAAKARAGKKPGEGKGSSSAAAHSEALADVARISAQLDKLEAELLRANSET